MKTRGGNSEQRKAGRSPRETVTLKEHFGRRLAAYAAAASAAGVGLLATPQPARADIVYTPANVTLLPGQTLSLDINHDGTNDFSFTNFRGYGGFSDLGSLKVYGLAVGGGILTTAFHRKRYISNPSAVALPRSARIGPSGNFGNFGYMASTFYEGFIGGSWAYATNKFLGLELQVSGKGYFGWAEFSVGLNFPGIKATLEGYAYNTVPNDPILAGQGLPTPEPGTLGLLALGSLGLGFWRRRKQEPVTSSKLQVISNK